MVSGITPKQKKVLIGITIFALVWILIAIPIITSNGAFLSQIPPVQYLIASLGFMCLSIVFFGTFLSLKNSGFTMAKAIKKGLAVWFSFSFVLDVWQPPFLLDSQGNTLITNGLTGINATPDAAWMFVFKTLIPSIQTISVPIISTSLLFVMVYGFLPLATAFTAAYVLTEGQFLKWIKGAMNV